MDIKVKREYVAYDGKVFDSQEAALKHEDELNREKVTLIVMRRPMGIFLAVLNFANLTMT